MERMRSAIPPDLTMTNVMSGVLSITISRGGVQGAGTFRKARFSSSEMNARLPDGGRLRARVKIYHSVRLFHFYVASSQKDLTLLSSTRWNLLFLKGCLFRLS